MSNYKDWIDRHIYFQNEISGSYNYTCEVISYDYTCRFLYVKIVFFSCQTSNTIEVPFSLGFYTIFSLHKLIRESLNNLNIIQNQKLGMIKRKLKDPC